MCKMLVANGADVDAQNAGGNTPLHMVTSYDIDDVKAYLDEQGANGTVKNHEGFQARYGLSGEKDPTSVAFAVETFRSSSDEKSLLNALDTLKKKATFPGIGLKVKKANKESGAWSEKVQKKFTELVQSLE
jgi:ankyrin repeat protein